MAIILRVVMRISRARWFTFLRRVFQYQNGPRSDLSLNPFNSTLCIVMELIVLLTQMIVIAIVLSFSTKEKPIWPIRVWMASYNLGNFLSLPLLYWRWMHCRGPGSGSSDLELQRISDEPRSSYLMNKARTFLELFFAIWFVVGNVWVFDARYGNFNRAPKLHFLCIALLTWNAIVYSFPFVLFVLLCCCVPIVSRALGYNMNMGGRDRRATDDQISQLPHWTYGDVAKDMVATENSECCICLTKYKDREEVRQLPCLHIFHVGCVDQWLKIISCCPLCKQELER